MKPIKIAQFGLGPIGIESLKLAAEKPWAEIVGAVDIDPQKVGQIVAGARVYQTVDELWQHAQPDVVLHTAGSQAATAIEQITPIAQRGVSVVSSCEELLFPALRASEASAALDKLCQSTGARVLGTGVNPGFVMDVLPVCLTGVSRRVERIYVARVVNASTRRMPLQKKIGSGIDPDEFRKLFRDGRAGHAGFRESVALVAHAMGWKLTEITETCEPAIAEHDIQTQYFKVAKGMTCGLHQRAFGTCDGETKIEFDLQMYLDAPHPHDLVRVEGDPPVEALLHGGVAGDQATVAALLNAIPRLLNAPAGVRLMTELSMPCWA